MPKPTSNKLYGGAERFQSNSLSDCTLPMLFLGTLGILRITQEGSLVDPIGILLVLIASILFWKMR